MEDVERRERAVGGGGAWMPLSSAICIERLAIPISRSSDEVGMIVDGSVTGCTGAGAPSVPESDLGTLDPVSVPMERKWFALTT